MGVAEGGFLLLYQFYVVVNCPNPGELLALAHLRDHNPSKTYHSAFPYDGCMKPVAAIPIFNCSPTDCYQGMFVGGAVDFGQKSLNQAFIPKFKHCLLSPSPKMYNVSVPCCWRSREFARIKEQEKALRL